jgi:PAS domain S-box-containing protein
MAIERKRMEQDNAARKLEFRNLAETSPEFIVRYDREGRHLYLNDRLLKMLGLANAEDVIGKRPGEVWTDGRFAELEQAAARAVESGSQVDVELIDSGETGSIHYHQIFIVPERDASGHIVGTIAFGRKITAIREAERKLKHFIENLPGMAFTLRRWPDGHVSLPYASPAIEEFYGLKPEDVKDDIAPLHLLAHPEDRPRIEAAMAEAGRTMAPFRIESRVCRSGQPVRWLDVRSAPEREADGCILWHGIMLDITERKQAEEALRASERKFRTLAEGMPDNLMRFDRQCRLQYMNPAMRTSLAPEVLMPLGKSHTEAFPGVDSALQHQRQLERLMETGEGGELEVRLPNPQGDMRTLHVRYVAERDEHGEIVGALSIGRDITERKHAEREREAHANSLECMDRINRAIQGTNDLEQMMSDVLDAVLAIFGCDRAFLAYPCNPDANEWSVPMERTKPEYPGARALGMAVPMGKEVAGKMRIALNAAIPVKFGPGAEHPLPPNFSEQFGIKSLMSMVLHPKLDQPWEFGIQQCAYVKAWTEDDAELFQKIGWRLSDALTSLLMHRNLQASEREFRTLAENLPDILVRYDREGRRTYINRAFELTFPVKAEQLIGKTLGETNATGMQMPEKYRRALEHTLATGERSVFEIQFAPSGGNVPTHLCFIAAERGADGRITGAVAVGRDITERKLMENEIRRREQEFRSLAENSPDPIFRYDRNFRRIYTNPASSMLSGHPVESLIGATPGDGKLLAADDAARLIAGIRRVFDSGESGCVDLVAVDREGKQREYQILLVPEQDEKGIVSVVLGIAHDITAIRDAERQMTEFVANLPGFAYTFRLSPEGHGSFPFASPGIEKLVGLKPEDVKEDMAPLLALAHPDDAPRILAAIDESARTMTPYHVETRARRPDLSEIWTELRSVPVRQADGSILWHGIMLDIDERKRYEAELERYRQHLEQLVEERTHALSIAKETAEAATQAKSRFLAAASHDLRQPISAIGLYNDALALSGLSEGQKRLSHNLTKSISSLGEMLNELLDISKLDAGKLEPQPAVIQSVELLGTIASEFDSVAREKHLSLNLFCPRRNLALFTDKTLLLTILRNLIGNAVKYTKQGGILVSIRQRDKRALIQVWDTGIGIAPEQLDLIFEEFFQAGNSERNRAKGAGLGLAIVKRVSEALGNRVSCRSRLGRGSVFEISLPLAQDMGGQVMPVQTCATNVVGALGCLAGKRIVIIEDDAMAAAALKLLLETHGMQVTHYGSAEDALGSMEAADADYYISDYHLPAMDGLQLLDAIQTKSAEPIKAVVLTGNTSLDQIAITQSSRWKVLFKPVALPELLAAMEL